MKQVWLADDATGGGKIIALKKWWDGVIKDGKNYGYYVNESKSWMICKSEAIELEARNFLAIRQYSLRQQENDILELQLEARSFVMNMQIIKLVNGAKK